MRDEPNEAPIREGADAFAPGCVRDFKINGQWVTARFERVVNPTTIRVRALKTLREYEVGAIAPGHVRPARPGAMPRPGGRRPKSLRPSPTPRVLKKPKAPKPKEPER